VTSIEERLVQDIEAVTGEIVTTEQDVREARAALERRIARRRQGDGRRVAVMVAAAASVVVVVATWQALQSDDKKNEPIEPFTESTQSPDSDEAFLAGDPPTTDQLLGVWRAHDPTVSRILWMFTADGVVRLDGFGNLADAPVVSGTFEIADGAIAIEVTGGHGLAGCPDTTWTLRATVNEDGGLNVVPTDVDLANMCGQSVRDRWVLDQLLPVPDGAESPSGASGSPPRSRERLLGTWYSADGGYLVELRRGGGYTMLAGQAEVADRGAWTVDEAMTRLALVSSADSATCREGDQLVLGALRTLAVDEVAFQGDVERNDCDVPAAGTAWVKLAP
jgi:hypothetical protein